VKRNLLLPEKKEQKEHLLENIGIIMKKVHIIEYAVGLNYLHRKKNMNQVAVGHLSLIALIPKI
jgi:hypothetical protein